MARADGLVDGSGSEGLMVERRQQMATQGGRFGEADGAGSCTPWPELQAGFRAEVGQPDVEAQYLCGPTSTNRSANDGECAGSMERRRQQGEAVGGGPGGAGAASCFPGQSSRWSLGRMWLGRIRRLVMAIVED